MVTRTFVVYKDLTEPDQYRGTWTGQLLGALACTHPLEVKTETGRYQLRVEEKDWVSFEIVFQEIDGPIPQGEQNRIALIEAYDAATPLIKIYYLNKNGVARVWSSELRSLTVRTEKKGG